MAPEGQAVCYVDTSALIKRYLFETGSDAFDAFCEASGFDHVICPLGVTEFSSTLQRRIRLGSLSTRQAGAARRTLLEDVASGGWRIIDFEPVVFSTANHLLVDLGVPVSTLDVLHLACAIEFGAAEFATADRQLATAARKARLRVHAF